MESSREAFTIAAALAGWLTQTNRRTSILRAVQLLMEQASIMGVFPRSPCRLPFVALWASSSYRRRRGVKLTLQ